MVHFNFHTLGLGSLLLTASLLSVGCETSDPCPNQQAACFDLTLIGSNAPADLHYTSVSVKVSAPSGDLASQMIMDLTETAPAGVQGLLTFHLPDSFNALPDISPKDVIDAIPSDSDKVAKLKELRTTDPRRLHIVVSGTEMHGTMVAGMVHWDSVEEEDKRIKAAENPDPTMRDPSEWLNRLYFRVGKNQYIDFEAYLAAM